jgi:thiol:disulfide interchange protein DsbA
VKYAEMEKSFSVSTKLNRAKQLTYAYKVDSVPRVVVNGKYVITMEGAGGIDRVFQIVDQAIGVARKDKAS